MQQAHKEFAILKGIIIRYRRDNCIERKQARSLKLSLSLALLASIAHGQALPDNPSPNLKSYLNRTNLALIGGEFAVRAMDAESTRSNLTNPCHCYHEDNLGSVGSLNIGMWSYSMGVAGGVVGASYLAHRRGWHKLERAILMVDIVYDGHAAISNMQLQRTRPTVVAGQIAQRAK